MSDTVLNLILVTAMVVAALYTVMVTRLILSAIGLGVTSAILAVLIFRLASPLTAVFELSVCAGLISALFVSTITLTYRLTAEKLEERRKQRLRRFWLLPVIVVAAAVVLCLIHIPILPNLSAQPAENNVNIILWRLRHLDLLGQIVILLAGAFGVVTFFRGAKMTVDMAQLFWLCCVGITLVFIIGLYCLLATINLVRAVIGLELMTKAVTLLLILVGYVTGRTGLAQALAITLIVIEVVVIAVAMGVVLCVFGHNRSIDARDLRNVKG